ncbi:hypothetical protein L914_13264 [Phytophthora nicotianae]|uniref:CCHC-type domain-containing protein n=1 Tax=Phytophthora nicotianae TaxID=4792 RepID=W2MWZ9_PHYNI|nr:hypothetical protein L914_13264 [Phytophthora nicotianae]
MNDTSMNDTSMSDASRMTSTSLEHASFPHLSSIEWEALHRLAAASDDAVIQTLLTAGTEEQQRLAAQEFMARELADLRLLLSTPTQPKNKTDIVKLDVSTYNGEGAGHLHLNRWFCEIDIAVDARQLSTDIARTRFLLSKLGGKAKGWALGKLVADATCFPTMASMKSNLRLAFEPPQDENVQRSAFLSLKQGRMSMLEYIQHTRHLVSCITTPTHPVDMATQVHVFASGLNADYSVTASQAFDVSRPLAQEPGPERMEVDTIQHYGGRRVPTSSSSSGSSSSSQSSARTPRPLRCFRCKKLGHRAAVCRAPAPVVATVTTQSDATITPPAKNDDDQ